MMGTQLFRAASASVGYASEEACERDDFFNNRNLCYSADRNLKAKVKSGMRNLFQIHSD